MKKNNLQEEINRAKLMWGYDTNLTLNEQDIDGSDIDIMSPDSEYPSNILDDKPNLQDTKPKPKQAAPAGCNDPDWVNLPMSGTQGQPNYGGGKNNYCDRCAANNTGPNFPVIFINGVYHYDTVNGVNYCSCCTPQNTEHECFNGNCVQQVGGQYPDLTTCQQNCISTTTHYCVDCVQQIMSTYQTPGSCPQGMVDMGTNPNPNPGPCWDCVNLTQCQQGWVGHNTQADCQQVCQPPTDYECVGGQCVQQSGGQFANAAACQASGCGQQTATYNCTDWSDPNGCVDPGNGSGQFPTLDDCLISPCQCDAIILAWPLYLNNPNNPQGNWDGSPHDGPSNPNALNNQLSNIQNSNGYNSNNVTTRQRMRCREAAIQFWLANSTNVACCSDPGFAVGAANSDPNGCVATGFINMMNNFMVQHSNWPNNGCDWLQTRLTNAQTQQAQYNSSSNAYCKIQGKINFLNNFINTGTSTYLNGTATFTLGC